MYLSKVQPQPGFILSQLEQWAHRGDAYAQHQLLWQLFPGQDERDFLYRFEQTRHGPCYYVLSRVSPDVGLDGLKVDCKPFQPKLSEGDRLAYSLRANPTRMLRSPEPDGRGKRVDVLMHAKKSIQNRDYTPVELETVQFQAARDWLAEPGRLDRLGIELLTEPQVSGHRQHRVQPRKRSKSDGKAIQFTSVDFDGVLAVRDPDRFVEEINRGIGRAKSFGCGLIMIRRAA